MTQPLNLFLPAWSQIDSLELVSLLKECIGGQGQSDIQTSEDKWYLPAARAACEIVLTFKGPVIEGIESGPAFDQNKWDQIVPKINELLLGAEKIGRNYSFSLYPVCGSWHGERSRVQILPAPAGAPRPDFEAAEHPFILEFGMSSTEALSIAQLRRVRFHQQLTLLLNVLLRGRINTQLPRTEYFWTDIARDITNPNYRYVYTAFWAPLGVAITEDFSAVVDEALEEIDAADYYDYDSPKFGIGSMLCVPNDLDDSIFKYRQLPRDRRAAFDRAAFWVDLSRRQWPYSISAAFASLVSAIEAVADEPYLTHSVWCGQCGFARDHDVPGAGGRFQTFLDKHAPGTGMKKRRNEMYRMRSEILHGDKLMQLDLSMSSAFQPPTWQEYDLHSDLSAVTRLALRNWLKGTS